MRVKNDPLKRDRWARLRFSIIGSLLAAPPEDGELRAALKLLSEKTWRHPVSGQDVRFGLSTIERWYYAARHAQDPVATLKNRLRTDVGRFVSMATRVIETLTHQYREHSSWTVQLHVDNLRAALTNTDVPLPSYATVRRYFKAQGMFRRSQPKSNTAGALLARDRLERLEVRSFEVECVGQLWHCDFHHGSRKVLTRQGSWEKPLLFGGIDDRSRLVCHLQWYLDETAESLTHGLSQAFMKRGNQQEQIM
jgi:putative transposase